MSSLDQLTQFANLANSLNSNSQLDEAFTQILQSSAADRMAQAITELKDAGVDYRDYIPMSRQAIRAKQQIQRLEHEQRMQDLEFRAKQAEVEATEASARRLAAASRPVPAPPQTASV